MSSAIMVDVTIPGELDRIETLVKDATEKALSRLKDLIKTGINGYELFKRMKFERIGYTEYGDFDHNICEQVDQAATHLVGVAALRKLVELHPEIKKYRFCAGAKAGTDIEDCDDNDQIYGARVSVEVFAATRRNSNKKLSKDRNKVLATKACQKYVFFFAPDETIGRRTTLELGKTDLQVWVVAI